LPNGITVLSTEIPTILLRLEICFASGSAIENIPGTAHYAEHMLAGGPSRTEIHPAFRELYPKGMSSNACTRWDGTRYYVQSRASNAELMIKALVNQVFHPEFNEQVFETERGSILNEYEGSKEKRSFGQWFRRQLTGNQYALDRSAVGLPETIREIALDDVKNFIQKEYRATNCLVLSSGGLAHEELLGLLSTIDFPETRKQPRCIYPALSPEIKTAVFMKKHVSAKTGIYWTSETTQKEMMAAGICFDLLNTSPLGELIKKLRGERGLAYGVSGGASRFPVREFSLHSKIGLPNFEAFHEAAHGCLRDLSAGNFSRLLFDATKAIIETNLEASKQNTGIEGPANILFNAWAMDEFLTHDPVQTLQHITPETIIETARKHFSPTTFGRIDRIPE